jgi:putative endonuclease
MTNKGNSVFYTGVTNNLITRAAQHKQKIDEFSFTSKYNVNKLMYYEIFSEAAPAVI